MNLYDFLIIYLTLGSPFAVYYFLQHRSVFNSKTLWLKTILNFLFWLPVAYRFLRNNRIVKNSIRKFFASKTHSDSNIEKELRLTQKQLERIILQMNEKISVYELREIFERYAGLTLACQNKDKSQQTGQYKIFQIAQHNNSELAEICFERRNRRRLFHHQNQARRDFLDIFADLFESHSELETENLGKSSIKFVSLLGDQITRDMLIKLIELKAQTREELSVINARNDLWKPEVPKPLPINSTPNHLKALTTTATMSLRSKD